MKQAIMTAPGKIELRDVPQPQAGPGEVLLRVRRIGVCGSDIHVWHGKHPYTKYPVVQGHEFSAEVAAMGPGVAGLRVGQKVTAMPQIVCGRCGPCRRGDYHICDALRVEGFQAPGCAQEFFVARADWIVPLPDSLTFEQGAMVEPVAVAVHALGKSGGVGGRNVVVLGAGPIGNLVAQCAKADGAGAVLITDVSEHRLEIARRCGVRHASNPSIEPLAQAAGNAFGAQGFAAAVSGLAKGGVLVAVGVFGSQPRVDVGLVQDRELTIRGTLMYRREDYERAVGLIVSGQVKCEPLMSEHFPLAQYDQAYEHIERSRDRSMKVFIDVTA
jgi:2-desacetyl-2-hydroxyethyl bacteriochlorophyllide A dehydrogenase